MKKRVLIKFESNALGDNLAWIPYVEEYRKVNDCEVTCVSFFNDLFEKVYPDIKFTSFEKIDHSKIDLTIPIGYYVYKHYPVPEVHKDLNIHTDYNLQEFACLLLRLKYKEIKPKIYLKNDLVLKNYPPYVSVGVHSTAQCKYWNYPNGWEEIVSYLNQLNYDVYSVDASTIWGSIAYTNKLPKNIKNFDRPFSSLDERASAIYNSNFFIGTSSGMSWLAWALDKPVVLISGFTNEKIEFKTPYRLINKSVCNSCFSKYIFDQGDWGWCPEHKNTKRMFECSKSITPDMVKTAISSLREDMLFNKTEKSILHTEYYSEFLKSLNINQIIEINPGKGIYTKIFSRYFKNIFCISEFEPEKDLLNLKNQINNIAYLNKKQINDYFLNQLKNAFIYINIDKNFDVNLYEKEIEFWKTKPILGIGGHGWFKQEIRKVVVKNFNPNNVLLFTNDSWTTFKL
jgi:autotransporter strand-loop-strand O-heptosyltransferase